MKREEFMKIRARVWEALAFAASIAAFFSKYALTFSSSSALARAAATAAAAAADLRSTSAAAVAFFSAS